MIPLICELLDNIGRFGRELGKQPGITRTWIHGVSGKYKTGMKQKNGKVLPATSKTQVLSDFVSFIKETESQEVLVAHNCNRLDFPILLHSLRRQALLQQFLNCQILLLDSLTVITEEMVWLVVNV